VELPDAIEPDQMRGAAMAVIVILAIVLFVVLRFVQKVVTRVILAGLVLAGGFFMYAQRDDLDECQRRVRAMARPGSEEDCHCDIVGFEVTVPGCEALVPGNEE
jgi:hypothetical protein